MTNIELAYTNLDINQCPGEHMRNFYANSAVCDRNSFVSYLQLQEFINNLILKYLDGST